MIVEYVGQARLDGERDASYYRIRVELPRTIMREGGVFAMKSNFLAGMLVGALVGAAVGIIFAPEPGEETRERVKEGARKAKDAAADRARVIMRRGKDEEKESTEEA